MSDFVLETPRLRLRHLRLDEADIEAISAIFGDPVAMRFFPSTYSRSEVEEFIQRQLNRYATDGYGLWAITLKTNEQVIGDCGLARQLVSDTAEVEVGYHVDRSFQMQGYAIESALGCMKFAFDQLGLSRLVSMVRPENVPSRRVPSLGLCRCEPQCPEPPSAPPASAVFCPERISHRFGGTAVATLADFAARELSIPRTLPS
jgi:RimJ/RimL family protein N-acetyltransferase